MLVTIATCKQRIGATEPAHDAHIGAMIVAAQEDIESYLGQPAERAQRQYPSTCTYAYDSPHAHVRVVPSIDVVIGQVMVGDVDITQYVTWDAAGNRLLVPLQYVGASVVYTAVSGWTDQTVPEIVRTCIYDLVMYDYLHSGLVAPSLAGVQSMSSSTGGVLTESRVYNDTWRISILRRLDRWRRIW